MPDRVTVAVDDGHGADTPGKRSPDGSLRENSFNDQVCHYLIVALRRLGFNTIRTAPGTSDDSFADRISRARLAHARILVSVHANAGGGTGLEGFYRSGAEKSERLCRLCMEECLAEAPEMKPHAGNHPTCWKPDTKAAPGSLGLLRRAHDAGMAAVLVELGYMDTPHDLALLKAEEYRERMGEALARAVYRYVYGRAPKG